MFALPIAYLGPVLCSRAGSGEDRYLAHQVALAGLDATRRQHRRRALLDRVRRLRAGLARALSVGGSAVP